MNSKFVLCPTFIAFLHANISNSKNNPKSEGFLIPYTSDMYLLYYIPIYTYLGIYVRYIPYTSDTQLIIYLNIIFCKNHKETVLNGKQNVIYPFLLEHIEIFILVNSGS